MANPPYSQNWDINGIDREKGTRFKGFGVAPASKADYAFVLHGLYHLDKGGTTAIVLPANLFFGTSIPTCVLVFKGREARKNKDILFIDASND